MASLTGAHERAQLRRCNRAFLCIIITIFMCTGTCFMSWLTVNTWPVSRFMGPQICAHASHTHTHRRIPSATFQVPDATVQHVEKENQPVLSWLPNSPTFTPSTMVSDVIFCGQGVF